MELMTTRIIGTIATILAWGLWCVGVWYKERIIEKESTIVTGKGRKRKEETKTIERKERLGIGDRLTSIAITTFVMGNWLAILWIKV